MRNKIDKLTDFIAGEYRRNGFMLNLLSFSIAAFLTYVFAFSLFYIPTYFLAIAFAVLFLMFIFLPIVMLLGIASNRAESKNRLQDLVVECLESYGKIREGLEYEVEYRLAEGYTNNEGMLYQTIKILNDAIGGEAVFYCSAGPKYQITLKVWKPLIEDSKPKLLL